MDKINHYSMENPDSVYDEEALTALELAARTAAKVNGCVDAVNDFRERFLDNVDKTVAEYINRLIVEGMITVDGLRPSGDESGNTDNTNINKLLELCGVCVLSEGTFYTPSPIYLHEGSAIIGAGTTKTRIKSNGVVISQIGSADHIRIENCTLETDNGSATVQLIGTTTEPYTGARYSTIRNVDFIANYGNCLEMRGAWCVKFDHCRFFIADNHSGVVEKGTCNNVVYDHCQFIGLTSGSRAGAELNAEGGAQNCGISFRDCDFEGLMYGIRAYCVIGLNVSNIYAEGVTYLFHIDSCPNFNCNGGYAVFIERLCNVSLTNSNDLYAHSGGKISNVFCTKIGSGEEYLITAMDPRNYNLTVENVYAKYSGSGVTGDIYYYDRDINQAYGAGCFYPIQYAEADLNTTPLTITASMTEEESLKLLDLELVCKETHTPAAGVISVCFCGKWVYSFNINAVEYKKDAVVRGTPNLQNLRIADLPRGEITIYMDNAAENGKWYFRAKTAKGKMIANKEVN